MSLVVVGKPEPLGPSATALLGHTKASPVRVPGSGTRGSFSAYTAFFDIADGANSSFAALSAKRAGTEAIFPASQRGPFGAAPGTWYVEPAMPTTQAISDIVGPHRAARDGPWNARAAS